MNDITESDEKDQSIEPDLHSEYIGDRRKAKLYKRSDVKFEVIGFDNDIKPCSHFFAFQNEAEKWCFDWVNSEKWTCPNTR